MKQRKLGRASPMLADPKGSRSGDRRHFPRMILRRTVTYEGPPLPTQTHFLSGKRSRGVLLNISSGGICFKTKYRLQRNMVLKLNLPLNKTTPVVPTIAEVLRVRKVPKQKEYRAGLRFIL